MCSVNFRYKFGVVDTPWIHCLIPDLILISEGVGTGAAESSNIGQNFGSCFCPMQRGDSIYIYIDQDEVWLGPHLHAKIGPDRLRGSTGAPKLNILSKSRVLPLGDSRYPFRRTLSRKRMSWVHSRAPNLALISEWKCSLEYGLCQAVSSWAHVNTAYRIVGYCIVPVLVTSIQVSSHE